MTGSVIKATGAVEFEDGLRTRVLPGGCWCPCGGRTYPRINSNPPGMRVGPGLDVVVIRTQLILLATRIPSKILQINFVQLTENQY